MDFPIDFVYLWVDDKDPLWQAKKAKAEGSTDELDEAHDSCRFANSDELLFSLRSLFANCPWFNHIYIVTDAQTPRWLSPNATKITIIDHTDIFKGEGTLPTFNSNVIESRLHHIEDLSEHYITMNDDVFIGAPVEKSFFFFDDGTPKLFMSKEKPQERIVKAIEEASIQQQSIYHGALNRSRKEVFEKYNTLVLSAPKHTPRPFLKSHTQRVEETYNHIIPETLNHQFRSREGLHFLALCMYTMIAEGASPIKTTYWATKKSNCSLAYTNYIKASLSGGWFKTKLYLLLISLFRPAFFCLNDNEQTTDFHRTTMVHFLESYFRQRGPFEQE